MYEWFAGCVLSATLLVIEHLGFWHIRLPRVTRYTLGVVALNLGCTLALVLRGQGIEAVGVWAISGIGGALVAGLHLWREQRGEPPQEIEDAYTAGVLTRQARQRDHREPS